MDSHVFRGSWIKRTSFPAASTSEKEAARRSTRPDSQPYYHQPVGGSDGVAGLTVKSPLLTWLIYSDAGLDFWRRCHVPGQWQGWHVGYTRVGASFSTEAKQGALKSRYTRDSTLCLLKALVSVVRCLPRFVVVAVTTVCSIFVLLRSGTPVD